MWTVMQLLSIMQLYR